MHICAYMTDACTHGIGLGAVPVRRMLHVCTCVDDCNVLDAMHDFDEHCTMSWSTVHVVTLASKHVYMNAGEVRACATCCSRVTSENAPYQYMQ